MDKCISVPAKSWIHRKSTAYIYIGREKDEVLS